MRACREERDSEGTAPLSHSSKTKTSRLIRNMDSSIEEVSHDPESDGQSRNKAPYYVRVFGSVYAMSINIIEKQ